MDRFYTYYQRLGLSPGDSWHSLRRAYKAQMRRWHPDRFTDNELERHRAEEQTKEINRAYQELIAFYDEHGRLPLDAAPSPRPSPHLASKSGESGRASTNPPTRDWPKPTAAGVHHGHGLRNALGLAVVLLVGAGIIFWSPDETSIPPTDTSPGASAPLAPLAATDAPTASESPSFFAVGSTFGDVHAIQGTPTRVEGDTWHYGEASVHFHGGRVADWIDSYPPRLKVSRDLENSKPAPPKPAVTFRRGSTKDEVRAIQGTPLRESQAAWDYGLSRVYFDRNGQVTGWQESPLDPLRVAR